MRIRYPSVLFTSLLLSMASNGFALPQIQEVVSGKVEVTKSGKDKHVIKASDKAIINYKSFNIGKGESVQFVQPSASSSVLGRVVSNDASNILGSLSSNGKLFLVNPKGVFFGPGAIVNAGSLIVSSLDISNEDFLKGKHLFTGGKGSGKIVNMGTLCAAKGGSIALISSHVRNEGLILAEAGRVALLGAQRVTLDFDRDGLMSFSMEGELEEALVEHLGKIEAPGGAVFLNMKTAQKALHSVVNTDGIVEGSHLVKENGQIRIAPKSELIAARAEIEASDLKVQGKIDVSNRNKGAVGGSLTIFGDTIALASAQIDASGDMAGGKVLIGGDYMGSGGKRTAKSLQMDETSKISASAITSGNGGRVILWSDGTTIFNGKILAQGGEKSGNGGFVETSGKKKIGALTGFVNTVAPNGKVGNWLLDPLTVNIGFAGGVGNPSDCSDVVSNVTVSVGTLNASLSTVNFCVFDKVTFDSTASITMTTPGAGLTFSAAMGATSPFVELPPGLTITTNAGDVTFNIPLQLKPAAAGEVAATSIVTNNGLIDFETAAFIDGQAVAGTQQILSLDAGTNIVLLKGKVGSVVPPTGLILTGTQTFHTDTVQTTSGGVIFTSTGSGGVVSIGGDITTTGLASFSAPPNGGISIVSTPITIDTSGGNADIIFSGALIGMVEDLTLSPGTGNISVSGVTDLQSLSFNIPVGSIASILLDDHVKIATGGLTIPSSSVSFAMNNGANINGNGSFNTSGPVTLKGSFSFTGTVTNSTSSTLLSGLLVTDGQAITLGNGTTALTLGGNTTLDATAGGGAPGGGIISISGTVDTDVAASGPANFTLNAGTASALILSAALGSTLNLNQVTMSGSRIELGGNVRASGDVTFNDPVTTGVTVAIDTTAVSPVGANIFFASSLDSSDVTGMTLTAGTGGAITVTGTTTLSGGSASLTINSAESLLLTGDVNASALSVNGITTGVTFNGVLNVGNQFDLQTGPYSAAINNGGTIGIATFSNTGPTSLTGTVMNPLVFPNSFNTTSCSHTTLNGLISSQTASPVDTSSVTVSSPLTLTTQAGDITVHGTLTLGADATFDATAPGTNFANINITEAITGAHNLTLLASPAATITGTAILGPVGSLATPLTSLSVSAGTITQVGDTFIGSGGLTYSNLSAISVGGNIFTNSAVLFDASTITLTSPILIDTTFNGTTAGNPLSFNGGTRIDSAMGTAHHLTLQTGSDTITLTGPIGATVPIGILTINSAGTVDASALTAAISATGIDEVSSTGANTFGGALSTTGPEGIVLNGTTITFNSGALISTANLGSVLINNSDLLTLPSGVMATSISGSFSQVGTGAVNLGANITANGGDIVFLRPVTLTDNVNLTNTSFGTIFFGPVGGVLGSGSFALNVLSGGNVIFESAIGAGGASPVAALAANGRAIVQGSTINSIGAIAYIAQDSITLQGDLTTSVAPMLFDSPQSIVSSISLATGGGDIHFTGDVISPAMAMSSLNLNSGSAGVIAVDGSVNLGNLTIIDCGNASINSNPGSTFIVATSTTLNGSAGVIDFNGPVSINQLNTTGGPTNYGLTFANGGSITTVFGGVFNNTGVVTLESGSSDALTITSGFTSSNNTTSFSGIIRTGGVNITTAAATLTGNTLLDTTNNGASAAGANITLGSVDDFVAGTNSLAFNAGTTGTAQFGTVGGSLALSALAATGATVVQTDSVMTTGPVSYAAPTAISLGGNITTSLPSGTVTLANNVILTSNVVIDSSAGNAAIALGGSVAGTTLQNLTLNAGSAAISVAGSIGVPQPLDTFTVQGSGSTNIAGLTLAASVALLETGGDITFNSSMNITAGLTTLANPFAVFINGGGAIGGATTFNNTSGVSLKGTSPLTFLGGLTSTQSNTTLIGTIQTAAGAGINLGAGLTTVLLSGDTTLDTTNGSPAGADITLAGVTNAAVSGESSLTINAGTTGALFINATAGGIQPLKSLAATGAAITQANGVNVNALGAVSYTTTAALAPINLGGNITTSSGAVTMTAPNGSITLTNDPIAIVTTSGSTNGADILFTNTVDGTAIPTNLTIDGGFGGNVSFGGAVNLAAGNFTLTSSNETNFFGVVTVGTMTISNSSNIVLFFDQLNAVTLAANAGISGYSISLNGGGTISGATLTAFNNGLITFLNGETNPLTFTAGFDSTVSQLTSFKGSIITGTGGMTPVGAPASMPKTRIVGPATLVTNGGNITVAGALDLAPTATTVFDATGTAMATPSITLQGATNETLGSPGSADLTLTASSTGSVIFASIGDVVPLHSFTVSGGTVIQNGSVQVTTGGVTYSNLTATNLSGNVVTGGSAVTYTGNAIALTHNVLIDTTNNNAFPAGAAISFNGGTTIDGDRNLTLQAGSAGAITFTGPVGMATPLGILTINSAGSVDASAAVASIFTTAFDEVSATGANTFGGTLSASGVEGIVLNGGAITFISGASLDTGNGGPVVINNSGLLTLPSGVTIPGLTGSFSQLGAGAVFLGASITTNGGNMTFVSPVTLTGNVVLTNTSLGNILFGPSSAVSGAGSFSLSATTGGNVVFEAALGGGGSPLTSLTVAAGSSIILVEDATTNGGAMTFTSPESIVSSIALSTSGGNIHFTGNILQPAMVMSTLTLNAGNAGLIDLDGSVNLGGLIIANGGGTNINNNPGSTFTAPTTQLSSSAGVINFNGPVAITTLSTSVAPFVYGINLVEGGTITSLSGNTFSNTGAVLLASGISDALTIANGFTSANNTTLFSGVIRTAGSPATTAAVLVNSNTLLDTTNNGANAGANITLGSVDDFVMNTASLNLNAGTGAISFDLVGMSQPLSSLSATGASILQNGNTTTLAPAGVTYTSPAITLNGIMSTAGGQVALVGPVVVGASNIASVTTAGGHITASSLAPYSGSLSLNGGAAGLINILGNVNLPSGTLNIDNSLSTTFNSSSGTFTANNVNLNGTVGNITFNEPVAILNGLTTLAASTFGTIFNNGGAVAGSTVFNNSGGVTLKSGSFGALAFRGGLTSIISTNSLSGFIQTQGNNIDLGVVNVNSDTILDPFFMGGLGGDITFENTVDALFPGESTFIANAGKGTITVNSTAPFGSNVALGDVFFTGSSVALGANVTTRAGSFITTGPLTLDSPLITIITTNSGATAGSNIFFNNTVLGNNNSLTLDAGRGGVVTFFQNLDLGSGTFTLTNSQNTTVTGQTTAATVALQNSSQTVTFDGQVAITTALTTVAGPYAVAFNNGGAVAGNTTFNNSGGTTLKSGSFGSLTFAGGLTSTSSPTSLLGNVYTNSGIMTLGRSLLLGSSVLDTTAVGAFAPANLTTGTIDGAFNLVLNAEQMATGAIVTFGTVGAALPIANFTVAGSTINQTGNVKATGSINYSNLNATNLSGNIVTAGPVNMDNCAITLLAPVLIDTTNNGLSPFGAAISFTSGTTINGAKNLTMTAGASGVTFTGAIGGTLPLASLTVTSASQISLGGSINSAMLSLTSNGSILNSAAPQPITVGVLSLFNALSGTVGTAASPISLLNADIVIAGASTAAYFSGTTGDQTVHCLPSNTPPLLIFNGTQLGCLSKCPTCPSNNKKARVRIVRDSAIFYMPDIYSQDYNLASNWIFHKDFWTEGYVQVGDAPLYAMISQKAVSAKGAKEGRSKVKAAGLMPVKSKSGRKSFSFKTSHGKGPLSFIAAAGESMRSGLISGFQGIFSLAGQTLRGLFNLVINGVNSAFHVTGEGSSYVKTSPYLTPFGEELLDRFVMALCDFFSGMRTLASSVTAPLYTVVGQITSGFSTQMSAMRQELISLRTSLGREFFNLASESIHKSSLQLSRGAEVALSLIKDGGLLTSQLAYKGASLLALQTKAMGQELVLSSTPFGDKLLASTGQGAQQFLRQTTNGAQATSTFLIQKVEAACVYLGRFAYSAAHLLDKGLSILTLSLQWSCTQIKSAAQSCLSALAHGVFATGHVVQSICQSTYNAVAKAFQWIFSTIKWTTESSLNALIQSTVASGQFAHKMAISTTAAFQWTFSAIKWAAESGLTTLIQGTATTGHLVQDAALSTASAFRWTFSAIKWAAESGLTTLIQSTTTTGHLVQDAGLSAASAFQWAFSSIKSIAESSFTAILQSVSRTSQFAQDIFQLASAATANGLNTTSQFAQKIFQSAFTVIAKCAQNTFQLAYTGAANGLNTTSQFAQKIFQSAFTVIAKCAQNTFQLAYTGAANGLNTTSQFAQKIFQSAFTVIAKCAQNTFQLAYTGAANGLHIASQFAKNTLQSASTATESGFHAVVQGALATKELTQRAALSTADLPEWAFNALKNSALQSAAKISWFAQSLALTITDAFQGMLNATKNRVEGGFRVLIQGTSSTSFLAQSFFKWGYAATIHGAHSMGRFTHSIALNTAEALQGSCILIKGAAENSIQGMTSTSQWMGAKAISALQITSLLIQDIAFGALTAFQEMCAVIKAIAESSLHSASQFAAWTADACIDGYRAFADALQSSYKGLARDSQLAYSASKTALWSLARSTASSAQEIYSLIESSRFINRGVYFAVTSAQSVDATGSWMVVQIQNSANFVASTSIATVEFTQKALGVTRKNIESLQSYLIEGITSCAITSTHFVQDRAQKSYTLAVTTGDKTYQYIKNKVEQYPLSFVISGVAYLGLILIGLFKWFGRKKDEASQSSAKRRF